MQPLSKLYEELRHGYFVVPEIQRGFVWRNTHVLELATSIYKKLPIGAICVCDLPQYLISDYKYLFRPLVDDFKLADGRYVVIDGRQRLTSLLLIRDGKVITNGKERRLDLYFNPFEQLFQLQRGRRRDDNWFRVSEVLHADDVDDLMESRQLSDAERRTCKRYLNHLRDVFRNYQVAVVNVEIEWDKEDLIKVFQRWSEMFVKLNSTGTKVKLHDLVLALITGKTAAGGTDIFRKRFSEMRDRLSEKGYDVDYPPLIRAYLAISTGEVKFKEASKKLDSMKPQEHLDYLSSTERAVVRVLEIMKELGIRLRYLQSNYLPVIPSIAVYNRYLAPKKAIDDIFRKDLMMWLVYASIDRRYTGRLESDLFEDVSTLSQSNYEMSALLKKLRTVSISEDDLSGEYDDSHITLLSVLYAHNGARDWDTGSEDPPRVAAIPDEHLTVHHIFPETVLRKSGYSEEHANDVANITLISEHANAAIGDKDPSKYLRELYEVDRPLIERHFIPEDWDLWRLERYEDFLHHRRKRILEGCRELFA